MKSVTITDKDLVRLIDERTNTEASGVLQFEGVDVPVILLRSEAPGPVVWVEAALHGDENDGTAACLRLRSRLQGKLLRGSLILMPAANPDAYRNGLLGSPKDGKNLNRMGGSTEDVFSARWFKRLSSMIERSADVFADLHGGGRWLDVVPFAMVFPGDEASLEIARSLDVDFIAKNPGTSTLVSVFSRRGIPSVLLESGCGSSLREDAVERHCRNVLRILELKGMINGVNRIRQISPKTLSVLKDFYFPEDGALIWAAPVGAKLRKGDLIARYAGWPGLEVHELRSPVPEGVLLSVHTSSLIRKGAYAALIGAAS